MSLSNVVSVNITRETKSISQAGFGTCLVVGENPTFGGRIKYYSGDTILDDVSSDLTGGSSDPEYTAISKILSQSPSPNRVALGRVDVEDANMAGTLDSIKTESNDWYGLVVVSRTVGDVKGTGSASEWAEANDKIFGTASDDTDIIGVAEGTGSTDIAQAFKDSALDRSFVIYHPDAGSDYPEAALFGRILPKNPGSYTAKFKVLSAISVTDLDGTQSKNATDKKCNIYTEIGGVNILRNGTMGSGEWIDIIHFIDWLTARIQENVYGLLVREDKVPYTNPGITSVEMQVKQILQIGQNRGGISPTAFDQDNKQVGGYYTSVPSLSSIPTNDKASRTLNNVKFTAFLAGAIHKVSINGVVTY
jgi:hypothetical protein